jgi:hypothetical protein
MVPRSPDVSPARMFHVEMAVPRGPNLSVEMRAAAFCLLARHPRVPRSSPFPGFTKVNDHRIRYFPFVMKLLE